MKFKRTLSLILASLLCGGTLISCTDNNEGGTDTSNDSSSESVADTIDTAGTEDTEEPYVYTPVPENNALTIYVDAAAAEGGDGSESAPLQTISQAQAKIREIKSTEGLPAGGITVLFSNGSHDIGDGIVFTEEDSGTEECPITYASIEEYGAAFSGGTTLNPADFVSLNDDEKARLSDDTAKGAVVKIDLIAYGLTEAEWGNIGSAPYDGLYIDDEKMTVARYPNNEWLKLGKVTVDGIGDTPVPPVVSVDDTTWERIGTWSDTDSVWMHGYFYHDWWDDFVQIPKIDTEAKSLTMSRTTPFGARSGQRYYFLNIYEEIDAPGEFYIDRSTGTLYLYPTENFDSAKIVLATNNANIISATDVSYLTIKGFTVAESKKGGFSLTGDHITVDNCKMYNILNTAISAVGEDILIQNSELFNLGQNGINVTGGNVDALIPSNNLIYNNHIHHFSVVKRVYTPAISLNGCGNVASHNEVHDTPHMAMGWDGPQNIFEYNEVYNANLETSDCGAFYSGRTFGNYGTIIRYNYLHDIGSDGADAHAIYWDDDLSGQTAYGNVIVNVSKNGFHIGGGRDNVVENNLIVNWGGTPILYDYRARDAMLEGESNWFYEWTVSMPNLLMENQQKPAWVNAFSGFSDIIPYTPDYTGDLDDPMLSCNPANNVIRLNMCYLTRYGDESFAIDRVVKSMANVIELNLIMWDEEHTQLPNFESEGDPTLSEDSYAYKAGFEPIPFDKIGRVH